jgi:hypothetical protein
MVERNIFLRALFIEPLESAIRWPYNVPTHDPSNTKYLTLKEKLRHRFALCRPLCAAEWPCMNFIQSSYGDSLGGVMHVTPLCACALAHMPL